MAGRPKPSKAELDQKNQARRGKWLAKLGRRELSADLSDAEDAPHLSDWNQENIQALHGLQRGDVEPLITLLEDMKCGLHPDLRLWLASMLKGETETKWWLATLSFACEIVFPWFGFLGIRVKISSAF